jgi:hypothetical protein
MISEDLILVVNHRLHGAVSQLPILGTGCNSRGSLTLASSGAAHVLDGVIPLAVAMVWISALLT